MVGKDDIINYFKANKSEYYYEEVTDSIVGPDCKIPVNEFLKIYRKQIGQSFNCIYDDHLCCWSLLRCTECGTVIRNRYDEFYDPNFKCPTCTSYKSPFEYWTKEEIDNSEELQAVIKMYEKLNILEKESEKRQQARKGLQDWELAVKKFYFNNIGFIISLEINNITNKNKLEGLRLRIEKLKKDRDGWIYKGKHIEIPLSLNNLYYNLYYHLFYKPYMNEHPEEGFIGQLKGRSLYEAMEDAAKLSHSNKK